MLERPAMTIDRRKNKHNGDADALDLLKAEHAGLSGCFESVEQALVGGDYDKAHESVEALCLALSRHAEVEETLLYPLLRAAGGVEDLLDEARIDHRTMKELVLDLAAADPANPGYAAQLRRLRQCVAQHEKDEEEKLFPVVRKRGLDLLALGRRIVALGKDLAPDAACHAR